uniref:Uncharacterized protein n=1 Tax=Arundo donax TaxID=35708 RepID=A0A0A9B5T8_ARUDO
MHFTHRLIIINTQHTTDRSNFICQVTLSVLERVHLSR